MQQKALDRAAWRPVDQAVLPAFGRQRAGRAQNLLNRRQGRLVIGDKIFQPPFQAARAAAAAMLGAD